MWFAPGRSRGFTLIELMLSVAILALLLAIAVPAFTNLTSKSRLKAAAEQLSSELQIARSEAVAKSERVQVHVATGSNWCIGLDDTGTDCDCANSPNQCTIDGQERVVSGSDFENIIVQASSLPSDQVIFDNVRGLPDNLLAGESVTFQDDEGKQVRLRISLLGSVNLCSPSGSTNIGDYPDCP